MSDEKPERILRISAVLERTGLSRSTLYRRIENGTFPRQIKIAERCTGWRESAVDEWLNNPMLYRMREQPRV
jgi:prophage regulatory protein